MLIIIKKVRAVKGRAGPHKNYGLIWARKVDTRRFNWSIISAPRMRKYEPSVRYILKMST